MKALILEDNRQNAEVFRSCVEAIPSVQVEVCYSSSDFTERLKEDEFDVFIMDNNLPDGKGINLLTELRQDERYEHTPAVVVTGEDSREIKVSALEFGATDFLTKPIDVTELIARMKNMIALREYHLMLRATNENLEKLATTDSLTEVWNRRSFMDRLQLEIQRAYRFDQPLSVAMLDADHFKRVNDTYGHAVGDDVLVGIAKACSSRLRDIDIVGRLGGEEFAICLTQTPVDGGEVVAERIRSDIEELSFNSGWEMFGVSVSIGLTEWQRGESASDALDRADKALYEAKESGRNRICRR